MLTPDEMEQAAATLRGIVGAIESGEMTAPSGVLDRLHGSILALEALLGDQDAGG
ncbi:MAG: hypothetical protein M0R75_15160 [Dehalococcoidia bacterium]|nr:hypothetical protein [Dehalococcoidia bacterium]